MALALASKKAREKGFNYVGSGALLYGCIANLDRYQYLKEDYEREWDRLVPNKDLSVGLSHLPYTLRVKKILSDAVKLSKQYGHGYVGADIIMLTTLKDDHDQHEAIKLLKDSGRNVEDLRQTLEREMQENAKKENTIQDAIGNFFKSTDPQPIEITDISKIVGKTIQQIETTTSQISSTIYFANGTVGGSSGEERETKLTFTDGSFFRYKR